MNDPKRLLTPDGEDVTGFERELLLAVRDEQPTAAMSQRMLEATLAATAAPPAAAGVGVGAWLAGAAVAVGVAGFAAAAWLGNHEPTAAGSTLAAAARADGPESTDDRAQATGAPTGESSSARQTTKPQATTTDLTKTRTTKAQTTATQTTNTQPTAKRQSTKTPTPKAQTSKTQTTKTQTTKADEQLERTLREEVELLDQARRALNAGDAQGALAELTRYDRRFPSGMLRKESLVLRERASALTPGAPTPSAPARK